MMGQDINIPGFIHRNKISLILSGRELVELSLDRVWHTAEATVLQLVIQPASFLAAFLAPQFACEAGNEFGCGMS